MAVARSGARLFARRQRFGAMDLRALYRLRLHVCHEGGHASGSRRLRPSLFTRHTGPLVPHRCAGLRRAVVLVHPDRFRQAGVAVGAAARRFSRHLQPRLLPGEIGRLAVGAVGIATSFARCRPRTARRPPRSSGAPVMEWLGLLMLLLVAILLIATGLPAFMVLIGVAT